MATLTATVEDLMTPRLLGRVANESGLPPAKVQQGMDGAVATILDALADKADDRRTMGRVVELVSTSPPIEPPERLLDEGSPTKVVGLQLLRVATPDSAGLVARLGAMLGVGAKAASNVTTAAASIAVAALRKIAGPRLDPAVVATTLQHEREAIHDRVPDGLMPGTGVVSGEIAEQPEPMTPTVELREDLVQGPGRRGGWWWIVALIPVIALAMWLYMRTRVDNRVAAPSLDDPPQMGPYYEQRGTLPELRAPSSGTMAGSRAGAPPIDNAILHLTKDKSSAEAMLIQHIRDPQATDETTWIDLPQVRFRAADAALEPDANAQLKNLAAILAAYPYVRVRIGAYTDAPGIPEENQRLSEQRAENVRRALIELGIAPDRIEAAGYGPEARLARRVALRLVAR